MSSTIEDLVIYRLKKRFEELDIDFDKFNDILKSHNAFISGSFLLQIIKNDFYQNCSYDLDIYTFGTKNNILEKDIFNLIKGSIVNKINNNHVNVIKQRITSNDNNNDNDNDNDINDNNKEDVIKNIVFIKSDLLKNWSKLYQKLYLPKTGEAQIKFYQRNSDNKIFNNYKNINECKTYSIGIRTDYDFNKINAIVNFGLKSEILNKYQLIYYDDTNYKTPLDIINNFDFDFCANYWNGVELYIKNYDNILQNKCILNINKPRIFNYQNKRIVKYIKRGFNIKINYNDNLYDVIYINEKINGEFNESINLMIICEDRFVDIYTAITNLPTSLEKLIIYTYGHNNIIDNLPSSLLELRLYIWKIFNGGHENYINTQQIDQKYIDQLEKEHNNIINIAHDNILKLPFDCKVYINDELLNK
jgi:hypothetical protein